MTAERKLRVSIVVTANDEGSSIVPHLERLLDSVNLPCEVLVIYDKLEDTTVEPVTHYAASDPRVLPMLNTYGKGPAQAIRFGFDHARSDVVVVTMADGCDDPAQIDQMTRLVERGVVIAAASRYMRGGRQIGAPVLKSLLSRTAGMSLHYFARVGTHDATNSFKAYSAAFVREVGIESDAGFEVGIELIAKARRRRLPVAEIPTIWLERTHGRSHFEISRWLPKYLHWYFFAFGAQSRAAPKPATPQFSKSEIEVLSLGRSDN